jgi:hypothetical protein
VNADFFQALTHNDTFSDANIKLIFIISIKMSEECQSHFLTCSFPKYKNKSMKKEHQDAKNPLSKAVHFTDKNVFC